jgi:CheY-like chemotaxis protein
MEKVKQQLSEDQLNVLLVGNNPIEMGRILDDLHRVPGKKIITEIAFDIKSILERLLKFSPNFILIDDNIGRSELTLTINTLSSNKKTKDIPITVLKNSNYKESGTSSSILDYLLKQNLSPEVLYNALKNSLKFRRTQVLLYNAYQKRKGQLLRLVQS